MTKLEIINKIFDCGMALGYGLHEEEREIVVKRFMKKYKKDQLISLLNHFKEEILKEKKENKEI